VGKIDILFVCFGFWHPGPFLDFLPVVWVCASLVSGVVATGGGTCVEEKGGLTGKSFRLVVGCPGRTPCGNSDHVVASTALSPAKRRRRRRRRRMSRRNRRRRRRKRRWRRKKRRKNHAEE